MNSGVAYINGSLLFGGDASFATFVQGLNNSTVSAATLVPSTDGTVIEGYKAVYDTTLNSTYSTNALIEILLSINAAGQIAIQAAIQQPLRCVNNSTNIYRIGYLTPTPSSGRLYINSTSIYDAPLIDPLYLSHPAGTPNSAAPPTFMLTIPQISPSSARVSSSRARLPPPAPLSAALGSEVTPGSAVQSDADIETWIRSSAGTEYHPSGACAMLPLAQGGVGRCELEGLRHL